MKIRSEKVLKKCSVCHRPGHNKLICPLLATEQKVKNTNKYNPVFVKISENHLQSKHIIDLKVKDNDSTWQDVKVFQEKSSPMEKRVVVDFAEMVRRANEDLRFQIEESPRIEVRKKEITKPKTGVPLFTSVKFNLKSKILNLKSNLLSLRGGFINFKNQFLESFNFRRFAYGAVTVLILVALPFPAVGYFRQLKDDGSEVVNKSTDAFLALQSSTVAALQANLGQAQTDLNLALESFGAAQDILEKEHKALVYVMSALPIVGRQVESRQHLLVAGHHLALGNTYLIKGIEATNVSTSTNVTDKLSILSNHLKSAIPQYKEALDDLSKVDQESLPAEYQSSFSDFKVLFATFVDDMKDVSGLSEVMGLIFGSNEPKRYLLVFQNSNEIRATGGFMGSFGILDVQKGKIINVDIPGGGTYDLQGQLDVFVKPPLPLQLINKRWEFQDSNWFPDFEASAKKMAWFYQHGRSATVDGVIAINSTVLERILNVLGPVNSGNFGIEVASSDAIYKIQKQVEIDYDKEKNQPKEVLSDLAGQILSRTKDINAMSAVRLAAELNEALNQKEIQLYFTDQKIQNKVSEFGWTGQLEKSLDKQDYLMVVNSNIGAKKTNASLEQQIEHQSVVQADGSILDTVVIKMKNLSKGDELFYGGNYIDYLRVYVPEGAELVEAGGFSYPPESEFRVPEDWYKNDIDLKNIEKEITTHSQTGTRITTEFGKTVFGNWAAVAPGEESSVYFTYKLPFKVFSEEKVSAFKLLVQKQSGASSKFSTRIIYPEGWNPLWSADKNLSLAVNGAEYQTDLKTDVVIGLMMEKNKK